MSDESQAHAHGGSAERGDAALEALVVADVHVDAGHWATGPDGSRSAWENAQRCYLACVDAAILRQVGAFVVAGDCFRTHAPSPEATELIADGLRRLSEAKVPVIVMAGNHELVGLPVGHRHALARYADIDGVRVVDEPSVVRLESGLQVACLPWPRRPGASALIGAGRTSLEEAVSKLAAEAVERLAEEVTADEPCLFAGHLLVDRVRLGGLARGSETQMAHLVSEPIVRLQDLVAGPWAMAVLGHVHRRQALEKTGRVWYTGSPERHDVSDEGGEKGGSVVRFSGTREARMELVSTPARRFRTIEVDLDDPSSVEQAASAVEEGELVRLRYRGGDRRLLQEAERLVASRGAAAVRTSAPAAKAYVERERSGIAAETDLPAALLAWLERSGKGKEELDALLEAAAELRGEADSGRDDGEEGDADEEGAPAQEGEAGEGER